MPPSLETAADFCRLAEERGYEMATYRLAKISMHGGYYRLALERFRKLAPRIPSAAYWIYHLLEEAPELRLEDGEGEKNLALAATQGHIYARKREIYNRIKGRKGFFHVPGGVIDLVPFAFAAFKFGMLAKSGIDESLELRHV